ncbi:hypothetical protein CHL76_09525 [Marinococcus halophilus]|uniref:Aminotransferase V n=1 Tax=Marinococcus halophilus TaxID=1371 RepID=A0A510Y493_MARHA|nr:cysteine desulfurase family protein [Marinococcus halophilus]OZT79936.1 hypothetical protein CHL76_09525 [Marinococcus halophilus]GEK58148.1 aminotransferase V [Marinococcus halophilus]
MYFDNSATTQPYEEVLSAYKKASESYFANPSSFHHKGGEAERLLESARSQIARELGVEAKCCLFTSGGTEGNNIVIKGAAASRKNIGRHIITTAVEHPSVMESCVYLEEKGYRVTYLPVDREGRISVEEVRRALKPDTILVTVGHTNSEIGTVQPIEAIGEMLTHYPNVYFHTDYVQGAAKSPLNIEKAGLDFVTVSAHKFHGLNGTGMLYKHPRTTLEPLMHGGGQENGLRSGTENIAGAAAMAKALRLAKENYAANSRRIEELKKWTAARLKKSGGVLNSSVSRSSPFILNVSFPGIKPEVLVEALAGRGVSISTKTACASKNSEPSAVVLAVTGEQKLAESAVRISFSADTQKQEADYLCSICEEILPQLKKVMEEQQ